MSLSGFGISLAFAGLGLFGPDLAPSFDDEPAIYGGELVGDCAWPSVAGVHSQGSGLLCSATLIHPEFVMMAAHCLAGDGPQRVTLGPGAGAQWHDVDVTECEADPDFEPDDPVGHDFAWCRLAAPIDDIDVVRLMDPVEAAVIGAGAEVVVVGLGQGDDGLGSGVKRMVTTTIVEVDPGGLEVTIGGGGRDSCAGDSGGPVFLRLGPEDWRMIAVTSRGGACGEGGIYGLVHPRLEWLEETTGVSLTPCECSLATSPNNGGGPWCDEVLAHEEESGCSVGRRGPLPVASLLWLVLLGLLTRVRRHR